MEPQKFTDRSKPCFRKPVLLEGDEAEAMETAVETALTDAVARRRLCPALAYETPEQQLERIQIGRQVQLLADLLQKLRATDEITLSLPEDEGTGAWTETYRQDHGGR